MKIRNNFILLLLNFAFILLFIYFLFAVIYFRISASVRLSISKEATADI